MAATAVVLGFVWPLVARTGVGSCVRVRRRGCDFDDFDGAIKDVLAASRGLERCGMVLC